MSPVFIIAEAGVNHNGDKRQAFELVDIAISCGADAIKFQTFVTENMVTKTASKASYQIDNNKKYESQYQMLKNLELPRSTYFEIQEYCKKRNIEFMSTAFDLSSLDFLINELSINRLKFPSGEINNAPLLLEHTRSGKPIIISTGMSTNQDIINALGVAAFGYLNLKNPSIESFKKAYKSDEGQEIILQKVSLLHCTTEYPTVLENVNLNAMKEMMKNFGLSTGYSDHTEGFITAISAVAMGAKIIEKHITLDKNLDGPDHSASSEPEEFKLLIDSVRNVELLLGLREKNLTEMEIKNKMVSRKSIVAKTNIIAGDKFSYHNLTCKRPGNGIDPFRYWDLIGTIAKKTYQMDDQIDE